MIRSSYGLDKHGLVNLGQQFWNLTTGGLYEQIIRHREGMLAHNGPVVVRTGTHTGRAPNDKFIVKETCCHDQVWWGPVNRPISEERFENLSQRMRAYLQGKDLFVQDVYAGADPNYRYRVRVITETAWHSLFVRNLFISPRREELVDFAPDYVVINAPNFQGNPEIDGINSPTFIIPHFGKNEILIGGTSYAGEIKKSVFTLLNYVLPTRGVLPMHCSANIGEGGDTALFFGLSGTGKTTLSADPRRRLIGDDEHGWSDDGVFNFEGGCYAKVIRLSSEAEPEIYSTTKRFGTILENVAIDSYTRRIDLNDETLTENTRGAYPLGYIPNSVPTRMGGHPNNVIFLTADAFGILPPIAKLGVEQAMYHFLSGYTAKVAGTEKGVTEPKATFSTCFGAPFMVRFPSEYARLLRDKVTAHGADCWLVNTGWTGGPYGVGRRMPIRHTRALLNAVLEGRLKDVPTVADPVFGVRVPESVEGVPEEILHPRRTWADPGAYDAKARELARMFIENFRQFDDPLAREIEAAGPVAD